MFAQTPSGTQPNIAILASDASKSPRITVVGGGPVGMRFVQEVLERAPDAHIALFSNEASPPYNRVQLSSLLAGNIHFDEVFTQLPGTKAHPNFSFTILAIQHIDTENRYIEGNDGRRFSYDKLVIATGARPHVPKIPGIDQSGVFTFRDLKDTEHLYARRIRSRRVVVVGGGLLGLEAAKAMIKLNTRVTLVQQGSGLMNRQLNERASLLLKKEVEALGIDVIANTGVREILGEGNRVNAVALRDKVRIECDTVLICAGIRPNLELARQARLKIGKGILVDDQLKTSAEHVYAIGECCEHRGATYGLVNPGFEQAAVAADVICGGHSRYQGSLEISRLKVLGQAVCSMGEVNERPGQPFQRDLHYHQKKLGIYRKILLHRGRIIGAVAYQEWQEGRRVQEAFQQQRKIWPWQQWLFLLTGQLWIGSSSSNPVTWPATATICQCNNVSQAKLMQAINTGCMNPNELSKTTGAGTVCGSCKPLLNLMLGKEDKPEKDKTWFSGAIASLFAILAIIAIAFIPGLQVADSVLNKTFFESIWNDKYWKQVTGFSLLALSVLGLLMSLRKRLSYKQLGQFTYWRLLHIVLGLLCSATLIFHTGFHLGTNLNRLLMINFLSIIAIGALAGVTVSIAHLLKPSLNRKIKNSLTWSHILVTWPLPILLGIHILTVYYF